MAATVPKPNPFSRPQSIILAIPAIVVIWSFSPVGALPLVLVAVAFLFLIGLKRPVWAMVALLVSQFTVTSTMIPTPFGFAISLRLLLLLLTALIMWRSFVRREIDLGPKARRVLIPSFVLLGLSVLANLVNSDLGYLFKDFRNMMAGVLIIVLLPAVTRNLKELKIVCGVTFIVIVASAVIGVMQYFLGTNTLIPGILDIGDGRRVPGMGESVLELAYILPVAFLAILGAYLARGVNSGNRGLLLLSLVPMTMALYLTYTRSALLALIFGIAALALFWRTRIGGGVILATLLLSLLLIEVTGIMGGQYLGGRAESAQEASSISRQILWQAGITIATDNPILGIGGDQYKNVSPGYADSVDPELIAWEEATYFSYRTLGNEQPHNDFLRVWIAYGTLALATYLWLFVAILRNFLDSYRRAKKRFIKGLSLGLAAALVAYGANAFYHNLADTLPLFWILAGFSLVATKLAWQTKGKPNGPVTADTSAKRV